MRIWTEADVRALGLVTDLPTAASILGIGRTKAYELARAGEFPVDPIPIGRGYRIPTAALLALLRLGDVSGPEGDSAGSSDGSAA
jgi:excisionase family DNA binding protein